MKKASEYIIRKQVDSWMEECFSEKDIIDWIKQAQIEAIEATVKLCAEKARITTNCNYFERQAYKVDEQSILSCAELLKKEL